MDQRLYCFPFVVPAAVILAVALTSFLADSLAALFFGEIPLFRALVPSCEHANRLS